VDAPRVRADGVTLIRPRCRLGLIAGATDKSRRGVIPLHRTTPDW
jgi:hypothetical protein